MYKEIIDYILDNFSEEELNKKIMGYKGLDMYATIGTPTELSEKINAYVTQGIALNLTRRELEEFFTQWIKDTIGFNLLWDFDLKF